MHLIKQDKSNKRYMLLQKIKLTKTRIANKKKELKARKQECDTKFEFMNKLNEELTM